MPPSSTAIIRSRREMCIYRFHWNFVQRYDISPSSSEIPILFPLLSQPTTLAMTIARTVAVIYLAYVRLCAGGFMRKATYLRPCAYVHARGDVSVCARARTATVELCNNCAKLRISVGDELRDLQYNCTTLSLPMFLLPRSCRRGRKNYSPPAPLPPPFEICAYASRAVYVFTMYPACKCVRMYARTCERTQTNTVTTPG